MQGTSNFCELVVNCVVKIFQATLNVEAGCQEINVEGLDSDVLRACNHIAQVLYVAVNNPLCVTWDVAKYASDIRSQQGIQMPDDEFFKKYPPIKNFPLPRFESPAVFVDTHGRILCWYLPNALPQKIQDELMSATTHLAPVLRSETCSPGAFKESVSDTSLFRASALCQIPPGVTRLSPALIYAENNNISRSMLAPSMAIEDFPLESKSWAKESTALNAVISAILRIVHPSQYSASVQAIASLRRDSDASQHVKWWTGVFSSIDIISNRQTPIHDHLERLPTCYGIYATAGVYKEATMHLPDIGVGVLYNTGAVVALCEGILQHGVETSQGERVGWAYSISKDLFDRYGIRCPTWPELAMYKCRTFL